MKIGMILERDYPTTPSDIRVEKEVGSLLQAGFEVDLLSLKITSAESFENIGGLNISRVPIPILCIRDWDERGVERHFHSEQSPWTEAVGRFIDRRKVDVLHVHDLPLVWTAAHAAKKRGIPVVFDMHEIYPPMVAFMRPRHNGWNPSEWVEGYEKECLDRTDRIITVVEESRDRLIDMGIHPRKMVVVRNTEQADKMVAGNAPNQKYGSLKSSFVVSYVGTFGVIRGLETLIRAGADLRHHIPDLHLLLVGGDYNRQELEALAADLGIEDCLTITGWVDFKEVPGLIGLSDICTVPHVKNDFTDATIPHKLFQYMLMGKPVVVSDAKPLKRIVEETGCGRVFKNRDDRDLAGVLLSLYKNPDQRETMGGRGRIAALEKYNWKKEEESLLELYRDMGAH